MVLDISDPPYVSINRTGMIEDIVSKAKTTAHFAIPDVSPKTPSIEQLFSPSPASPPLSEERKATFHSIVAKFNFHSADQDLTYSLPSHIPDEAGN